MQLLLLLIYFTALQCAPKIHPLKISPYAPQSKKNLEGNVIICCDDFLGSSKKQRKNNYHYFQIERANLRGKEKIRKGKLVTYSKHFLKIKKYPRLCYIIRADSAEDFNILCTFINNRIPVKYFISPLFFEKFSSYNFNCYRVNFHSRGK